MRISDWSSGVCSSDLVIPALQVAQQIDDLRLDRNVERRYRLIADQQFRPHDQRARDRDALTLATGEFTRMAHRITGRKTNLLQHFEYAGATLFAAQLGLERLQRLADNAADPITGIGPPLRVLKHRQVQRREGK